MRRSPHPGEALPLYLLIFAGPGSDGAPFFARVLFSRCTTSVQVRRFYWRFRSNRNIIQRPQYTGK